MVWVGTSSGLGYLHEILPLLDKAADIIKRHGKNTFLNIVCNRPINYESHHLIIKYKEWTIKEAVDAFMSAHIGLMPLSDTKSARGKGGFKLIQYMSVGLPSVASSVGINNQILSTGGGFLIDKIESTKWTKRIVELALNEELWSCVSGEARLSYEQRYSFTRNQFLWHSILE